MNAPDNNQPIDRKHLEAALGYRFNDPERLTRALCHSSYVNEQSQNGLASNERLEFLGDAVLNLAISHLLMQRFPDLAEGELSRTRAHLVNETRLAAIAREICIGPHLLLGKGEALTDGRNKNSILADAIEAVTAAIYLDGGMKNTEMFIEKYFGNYLEKSKLSRLDNNYKSALQEISQKEYKMLPFYHTTTKGEAFVATVSISKSKKASGEGKNKREAEQSAAQNLIRKLKAKKK